MSKYHVVLCHSSTEIVEERFNPYKLKEQVFFSSLQVKTFENLI